MKLNQSENILKFKTMSIWILLMAIFISQLLFYTWCRVQCVNVGYEITKETGNHRSLITTQNNLKIEISRLKSPERIAAIAKNELGLAMPGPEQMIVIHEIN